MPKVAKKKVSKKKVHKAKPPHTSASSITSFLSCRRQSYYHSVMEIQSKRPNLATTIGTIWHAIMQTWYTSLNKNLALKEIMKGIKGDIATGFTPFVTPTDISFNSAMLTGMFEGYHTQYALADKKAWKLVAAEEEFEIPNFLDTAVDLVGIIDGVVEISSGINKGLWVLEHKTTKDLSYTTIDTIKNGMQTMVYMYGVNKVYGIKPKGIIWNAVRKPTKRLKINQTITEYCDEIKEEYTTRPDFYYMRQQLHINQSSIQAWLEEMKLIMADIDACYTAPIQQCNWYKNTGQCGMYGGCEFSPLCYHGEKRSTLALFMKVLKK